MKCSLNTFSAKRSLGILCIGTMFCLAAPLAAHAKPKAGNTTTPAPTAPPSGSTTPSNTSTANTSTAPTFQSAFSLLLSPQYGSTENTGASAKLNFSFAQQGDNVLLNLDMTNTTNGKLGLGATASTLVGVAFDMPSFLNFSLTPSGSNFTQLWKNVNLSPTNQFGTYTAGISTPRNSFEGGNANGGLKAGESTTVSFLLSGGKLNVNDVRNSFLTGFSSGGFKVAGRFQQVNAGGGSDKVVGKIQIAEPPKPRKVPEPGLGLGLVVMGGGMLYRNVRNVRRRTSVI
ncbi:hypothetical protein [Alkalinema sp. FACHB-956]|uniref:hypothetical protein n=1 Tax=Alkalinema sp. FACHB-956 TaxID=2692768 RepID=UPI00168A2092|nr:hypothetical protein [Alkalinema sp. FACHB-956]MBD2325300.1 hypothetical protein [Alkalinema sp. FACHB-956]